MTSLRPTLASPQQTMVTQRWWLALALVFLAVSATIYSNDRNQIHQEHKQLADSLAQKLMAPMILRDKNYARQVMKMLEPHRGVLSADLIDVDGSLVSVYEPGAASSDFALADLAGGARRTDEGGWTVTSPVGVGGHVLGSLQLRVDTTPNLIDSLGGVTLVFAVLASLMLFLQIKGINIRWERRRPAKDPEPVGCDHPEVGTAAFRDVDRLMAEAGISVRYLPITQLDPSGLHSVEAMVQWLRPEGHLVFVSPAECVGMAERSGLVLPVEEWVMRTALSQIATWHKQHGSLGLSFNLTARQFMDPSFAARVRALCVECALPYQALNLEIHESVLALMPSNALQGFEHFARFGLNLSVDGFGSSVHSESLLHNCPIRRVKLDLRLVAKAAELGTLSERIQELARLAASLRVPLSAEGVVSDEQVQTMQALGCQWVQGSGVYQSLSAHTLGGILGQDEGGSNAGSRSRDAAMGAAAGKVSA